MDQPDFPPVSEPIYDPQCDCECCTGYRTGRQRTVSTEFLAAVDELKRQFEGAASIDIPYGLLKAIRNVIELRGSSNG